MRRSKEKLRVRLLERKLRDFELYVEVHNKGYSTEPWFGILQDTASLDTLQKADYDATFIAELNNIAVGLLDIKVHGDFADIENLVVLKEFRCKGVGRALLRAAQEYAQTRGCKRMRAEVPKEDEAANHLYRKFGFALETLAYLVNIPNSKGIDKKGHKANLYRVKGKIYWVPSEKDFALLKKCNIDMQIIGMFNVLIKNLPIEQSEYC